MNATAEVTTAKPSTLPEEVTVYWHAVETNSFLDALLESPSDVVARIIESAREKDIVYRDGYVFWLASQAPPLPVMFIARFDPRSAK